MKSLSEVILTELDNNEGRPLERGVLYHACAIELRRSIQSKELDAAVEQLEANGDVKIKGEQISRPALPFAELELEPQVELYLQSAACCKELKIEPARTVLRKTAREGARDTGKFSKPDFTIATVRKLKYDPLRYLDVLTFELKTAAGATLAGVHEALAHTRFAHYAYLVCPRTRVSESRKFELREECGRHGVGLMTFDLALRYDKKPDLFNFAVEIKPLRKAPDPFDVEAFLEHKLEDGQLKKLEEIAAGKRDQRHEQE